VLLLSYQQRTMTIELIPVIEIGYNNMGITVPESYPYWHFPEVWDAYHEECYKKAGFTDKLTPYLNGSSFYRPSTITDINLIKITSDHTQELREGKYHRAQACSFFGGYVLKVDNQDKYFPQCCGLLSDIQYWDKLSNGFDAYYEGHPEPVVKFVRGNIIFDFTVKEFDEHFQPTPPNTILTIDMRELKNAVDSVKQELTKFQKRLEEINDTERLNIDNIGELLIWNNKN